MSEVGVTILDNCGLIKGEYIFTLESIRFFREIFGRELLTISTIAQTNSSPKLFFFQIHYYLRKT